VRGLGTALIAHGVARDGNAIATRDRGFLDAVQAD
jgi:hypothetical protein